jgi:hypothetical protein
MAYPLLIWSDKDPDAKYPADSCSFIFFSEGSLSVVFRSSAFETRLSGK